MASTSFDKPSGASLAAMLLVVAVLAGSFAPAEAQEQYAEVTLSNELGNGINISFLRSTHSDGLAAFAEVGGFDSATVQVQLSSSPAYIEGKFFGDGPLAGLTYVTGAIPMSEVTSLTGLEVKVGGLCGPTITNGVKFAATLPPLGIVDTEMNLYSACVQPQIHN